MQLFPHQKKAYENFLKLVDEHGRVAIVMPTASGKFFIAAKWMLDNLDMKFLFVTPSTVISDQQTDKFETVYPDDALDNVSFITYNDLSIDTLKKLGKRSFDAIVIDEFHHIGAEVWGRGIEALTEYAPDAPILGLSATPNRPSDGGRDMGEEFFEGVYAAYVTLAEAWNDPDFPLYAPKYVPCFYEWTHEFERVRSKAEEIAERYDAPELLREIEQLKRSLPDAVNVGDVFARHLPKKDGHYIFFCSNKEHLKLMMDLARQWFRAVNEKITFYELYQGARDVKKVLPDFVANDDGSVKVLFAIDMINEGVHCDCDGVILSRPTSSPTVFFQQIGRAMDASGSDPGVIIDLVDNISNNVVLASRSNGSSSSEPSMQTPKGKRENPYSYIDAFDLVDETYRFTELIDAIEEKLRYFSALSEELVAEWHPTKNGDLKPTDVTAGSNRKVFWLCGKGHAFEAVIKSRTLGSGCPYCSGRKAIPGYNDLATTHPEIAAEWHPTKNGDLKPTDVKAGSGRKVFWKCGNGHAFETTICKRTSGSGCPYCSGRKVLPGYNDLATTHPEVAAEWHPTKNGDLKPTDVKAGSHRKVFWSCGEDHEYETEICKRTSSTGCPRCAKQHRTAERREKKGS